MKIQTQVVIDGKAYPIVRDMTPEEEKEYLENQAQEPEQPKTDAERIAELEETIKILLTGGTE